MTSACHSHYLPLLILALPPFLLTSLFLARLHKQGGLTVGIMLVPQGKKPGKGGREGGRKGYVQRAIHIHTQPDTHQFLTHPLSLPPSLPLPTDQAWLMLHCPTCRPSTVSTPPLLPGT